MAEIDPVILQLRADMQKYQADIRTSTRMVQDRLAQQERAVQSLERRFESASGAIASSLKGLAASFGAYFSAQQLTQLADGFTRIQNSLRVVGLEGEQLNEIQQKLFQSAQKYGAAYEGVAAVFSKATQAQKELGASSAQILQLTDAVGAALKVQGGSAEAASGALLQLGQTLAGSKVQAEEYNSLIDGLYPLLQAAANGSDRFGGSVAKLTAAVKGGEVSSREFFNAILQGSGDLEEKAGKATLTLAGAFTTLNNALVEYVGGASSASGLSGALANGIKALADNVGTLAEALAVLATFMGVKLVASAVAGSRALFALQAVIGGAATAAEGAAFAFGGMTAAMGGPIILAISALAAGIVYLSLQTDKAEASASALNQVMESDAARRAAKDTNSLTQARSKLTKETLLAAKAEAMLAAQQARRSLDLASRGVRLENQGRAGQVEVPLDTYRTRAGSELSRARAAAVNQARTAAGQLNAVAAAMRDFANAPSGVTAVATAGVSASGARPRTGSAGSSGPSASESASRQAEELARLHVEELNARLQLATDAQTRADLQREILDEERAQRVAEISASKDLSDAQKKAQIAVLDRLYGGSSAGADGITVSAPGFYRQDVARELERRQAELAADMLDRQRQALEAEAGLATGRVDRLTIERRILALLEQEEKARLESAIDAGQIADATAARAALERQQGARREGVERQFESPMERYRREAGDVGKNINDSLEQVQVDGLQSLNDGLTDAIMGTKSLGDVFKNVANQIIADLIRISIQKAIVGAVTGGLGSILPFAGGTDYAHGGLARVGETGPETVVLPRGAKVIPAGETRALSQAKTTIVSAPRFDLRGAVVTAELYADMQRISDESAARFSQGAYQAAIRDTPAIMAKRQRFGS